MQSFRNSRIDPVIVLAWLVFPFFLGCSISDVQNREETNSRRNEARKRNAKLQLSNIQREFKVDKTAVYKRVIRAKVLSKVKCKIFTMKMKMKRKRWMGL